MLAQRPGDQRGQQGVVADLVGRGHFLVELGPRRDQVGRLRLGHQRDVRRGERALAHPLGDGAAEDGVGYDLAAGPYARRLSCGATSTRRLDACHCPLLRPRACPPLPVTPRSPLPGRQVRRSTPSRRGDAPGQRRRLDRAQAGLARVRGLPARPAPAPGPPARCPATPVRSTPSSPRQGPGLRGGVERSEAGCRRLEAGSCGSPATPARLPPAPDPVPCPRRSSVVFVLRHKLAHRRARGHGRPGRGQDLGQHAVFGCGELQRHLLGLVRAQGFLGLDRVARSLQPFGDGAVGHGQTQLGHDDLHSSYPCLRLSIHMLEDRRPAGLTMREGQRSRSIAVSLMCLRNAPHQQSRRRRPAAGRR